MRENSLVEADGGNVADVEVTGRLGSDVEGGVVGNHLGEDV